MGRRGSQDDDIRSLSFHLRLVLNVEAAQLCANGMSPTLHSEGVDALYFTSPISDSERSKDALV